MVNYNKLAKLFSIALLITIGYYLLYNNENYLIKFLGLMIGPCLVGWNLGVCYIFIEDKK